MLDLSLFSSSTFAGANVVALLVTLAMFGVFFFMSIYMQNILGYSATKTGAAFLPMTILIILIAPIAGKSSDRIGSRALMTAGMLCLATSLAIFSRLGLDSTFWDILPGLIVGGFGMGLVMTPMTAAALGSVPVEKSGVGSGVLNTFRQVGGALGIAVMGAIVASYVDLGSRPPQPGRLHRRLPGRSPGQRGVRPDRRGRCRHHDPQAPPHGRRRARRGCRLIADLRHRAPSPVGGK